MTEKVRTICVGDVHGCLEEFEELLKKIQYYPHQDRLIVVGDLIDRGPDSVGVVRKCRELNLEVTMGNHEEKFLKWWKGNKHYDSHAHYTKLNDDDVNYISRMPSYIKLSDDLLVIHAGIKPRIPIEKQKNGDLLHLRYTDKDRNFISMHDIANGKATGAMFWTEFGPFPYSYILYGHNVNSYKDIRIDSFDDGSFCYGLDTGCCFGGHLSCAVIQENKKIEIVQVKAKQIYYKSDFIKL